MAKRKGKPDKAEIVAKKLVRCSGGLNGSQAIALSQEYERRDVAAALRKAGVR